ncbi:outer membrane beta-barrel protein [Helicobacter sp. T3_23-1059]
MKIITKHISKSIQPYVSFVVLTFVSLASLASLSKADEIQERIDKLKAENELLELQKKNAALKELDAIQKENELLELKRKNAALKRGESINDSSDFASTNSIATKTNRPCTQGKLGRYAPTGCFVGVEVGVAFGVENNVWGASGFPRTPSDSSGVSLPLTINGGFQWYFLANMGVRVRGNLGYSAHFADMNYGGINSMEATNHSIHYGVEVSYLYDFIATTKRTFGADVGFGIEGMTLFGSSAKDSREGSYNDGAYNKTISKFNFWQGRIGVHYYHNLTHQFWLSYIYKPYSSKWVEKAHDTTPNNFITLGYAYRF